MERTLQFFNCLVHREIAGGAAGKGHGARRGWTAVRFALGAAALVGFLTVATCALTAQVAAKAGPAASVNAIIGTGGGPGGGNNLFPGATTPFGMVQISPDTESQGYGYHYDQPAIQGFSMTHMSGPGCNNEGDVFFTATTGPVTTTVPEFQSSYSHSAETATAGYYQVHLNRWDVNAELTATDHTGVAQFTFPAGHTANILLPISQTLNQEVAAYVKVVGDRTIEGYVVSHIFCSKKDTYKVNFVMTFNRPFATFGTWNGNHYGGPGVLAEKSRTALQLDHDAWIGAYASWPAAAQEQTITAKIAISYVDMAGAENNMKTEAAGKIVAMAVNQ